MATSNQYLFNHTRDTIIAAALRKVNVLDDETQPSDAQTYSVNLELEALLKTYESFGMALWKIEYIVVPGSALAGMPYSGFPVVPLRVYEAQTRDNTNADFPVDNTMTLLTRNEFNMLSDKFTIGKPTQFWYDYHNTAGNLFVWPEPDDNFIANGSIVLTAQMPFQDAGNLGNYNLDFPTYWSDAIVYGLAYKISSNYGLSPNDRGMLMKDWQMFLEWAREAGYEEGSFKIRPNRDYW